MRAAGFDFSPEGLAEGFRAIADLHMAEAIREISVARGYDVRDYALVVFGGAGGQHACGVARRLGIETVVFHPLAGVLRRTASGSPTSHFTASARSAAPASEPSTAPDLEPLFAELEAEGRRQIGAEPADGALQRGPASGPSLRRNGDRAHAARRDRRGARDLVRPRAATRIRTRSPGPPDRPARSQGRGRPPPRAPRHASRRALKVPSEHPSSRRGCSFATAWLEQVPVYERRSLPSGAALTGPALVTDPTGSIVIEPGFSLIAEPNGLLVLRAGEAAAPLVEPSELERPDPVTLEIMSHAFMAIAEQMGQVLRRTALSTNIRERLDFSCAVFDREGGLVANAPHIPVHLGAMSESVQAVLREHPELEAGDALRHERPGAAALTYPT